jgi:hypothetical protein
LGIQAFSKKRLERKGPDLTEPAGSGPHAISTPCIEASFYTCKANE